MRDLNIKELNEINGGDEFMYDLGVLVGEICGAIVDFACAPTSGYYRY